MANTVFVSDDTVQQVLDWKEMVDKLAEAHAAELHADFAPPRTLARGLTGEWTRALCAVPAGPIMGTKFFALAAKGGGIRYCVALFQKTDSALVALVDANTVTARRTAGATAVALDKLAPQRALSLGILGSGHEASAHVHAIGTRRKFTSIKVFSPTLANREAFAAKFARELGIPCTPVASPREAIEGMDMVLGTTSTRGEPSLRGEYLTRGQCIGAIGSTLPEQWECDPQAMDRADLIVCDNAEEVQHGTGDFINARKAGVKFDGKVFDLPDLVKGKLNAKVKAAGITMYRSAGTGLQDVVVAELAWRRAVEKGLAVELPMQLFHKTGGGRAPAP
ncbi:MAG TPA: ornithine cyclodeaminase family protein [Stellaceae bacterium]|nr:ornithine cyclodeaminase family protein [Stellaceae bacterium]